MTLIKYFSFILNISLIYTITDNFTNSPLYPNTTLYGLNEYEKGDGICSNNNNCFLPYGICVNQTLCLCMPDYANVNGPTINSLLCSYKKKKLVIAGLLELFLPLGLGHFYSGHFIIGTIKFFYNLTLYSMCCLLYCKGHDNENLYGFLLICIFLSILIPIWNVIDLICFFSGIYNDGHGIPMN